MFPRDLATYLGWGFSRCAVEGLTLENSFGTGKSRNRGGPKWTSFAERIIAAEIFYCGLRLHHDHKVLTDEYIEDFFEYMRRSGEISLQNDTVIFGWDDKNPSPVISGLELLGHKAATQAVENTFSRTTGSKARKLLSEHKPWLLSLWVEALKIAARGPRPITAEEIDAFHDEVSETSFRSQ